jgi:HD superfamily phosphohydrolase
VANFAGKPIIHRDQVHGDAHYDPLSVALLNTKPMQRLGRVYQLGYGHLVFRGGTHTRLSHVMGAAHMATRVVDRLRFNYTQRRGSSSYPRHVVTPEIFLPGQNTKDINDRWDVLRHLVSWAALLHDIGHVPLGHTLEDEFEKIFLKHDDFASPRSLHLWSEQSEIFQILTNETLYPPAFRTCEISGRQVWQAILLICFHKDAPDKKDETKNFTTFLVERVRAIEVELSTVPDKKQHALASEKLFVNLLIEAQQRTADVFQPYMADIVGNTICADYLDYLRRDAINVGLDVLREERVLSNFYVCVDPKSGSNTYRMALALVDRLGKPRLDVCTGVVELVRQRFRFAESIYYHKTKVSASGMFAKALGLIGTLKEIGPPRRELYRTDIKALATKLQREPSQLSSLRQECVPSALLDPEIGDDGLHLLLIYQAFDVLERNLLRVPECDEVERQGAASRGKEIENSLRGIALLQGVLHRQLYKVGLSINSEQFHDLTAGAVPEADGERRLESAMQKLRDNRNGDHAERGDIEREMASAADWPLDSILLYVPPRKSQAKGIETLAFDAESVVRLDKHWAVREKVAELGRDYQNLWRLLVLVHPDHCNDAIGLSHATDILVSRLWSICGGRDADLEFRVDVIRRAAWFPYIKKERRQAARHLLRLCANPVTHAVPSSDWARFLEAAVETTDTGEATPPTIDHAERAYLIRALVDAHSPTDGTGDDLLYRTIALVKTAFPTPGALMEHVESTARFSYEGQSLDEEQLSFARRASQLNSLAKRLAAGPLPRQIRFGFDGAS